MIIGVCEIARDLSERNFSRATLANGETALAASRAETKVGVADLLISEAALASSQAEAKIGAADLLVVAGVKPRLAHALERHHRLAHLRQMAGDLNHTQQAPVEAMLASGKLDVAGRSEEEGAGLGLALSRRIATLMGGRLGHRNNPAGGSIFWLEPPLNNGATLLAGGALASKTIEAPLMRLLNVLVVDDVLMNCEIAGSFLRAGGLESNCVESGAEAIAAATTHISMSS